MADWVVNRYFLYEDDNIVVTEMGSSSTWKIRGTEDDYCLAKAIEYIEELEERLNIPQEQRRAGPHLEGQNEYKYM